MGRACDLDLGSSMRSATGCSQPQQAPHVSEPQHLRLQHRPTSGCQHRMLQHSMGLSNNMEVQENARLSNHMEGQHRPTVGLLSKCVGLSNSTEEARTGYQSIIGLSVPAIRVS